jgi:large subunit ribosomal protein L25
MVLLLVVGNSSHAAGSQAPVSKLSRDQMRRSAVFDFFLHYLLPLPTMDPRQQHIQLASSLPKRLLDFFRKYPPPALLQGTPATTSTATENTTITSTTPPTDPSASAPDSQTLSSSEISYRNPFQPHKHHVTGRWHSPVFGLRRQADLVKLAQQHGVVSLLPYTIKLPGERAKRREELGLRVKGTGIGQRVKGKLWERTQKGRLEERKKAMLAMPAMIQEWKQVCFSAFFFCGRVALTIGLQKGHGRGWKKWPK